MVSDKNFASRVEFEFTRCESSRAELGTASCESSRAASCRVELWSLLDGSFGFPHFFNKKKLEFDFLKVFFLKKFEDVLFCKFIGMFLILFMYGELECELRAGASWEKPLRVGEFASSSPTRNHPYA